MVTDDQVRRIALFFMFSLMDEKIAMQAAEKTVVSLKGGLGVKKAVFGASGSEKQISDATLIKSLRKNFESHRKQVARQKPAAPSGPTFWQLADGVDITAWARFQKDAAETEILAVVLAKILGFSEQDIAEGINVSIGTARYRIGKGIKQLGLSRMRA